MDASKNKIALKYKKPKKGAPLGAGVTAKVSIKLKGDFAAMLNATGFPNKTEVGIIEAVPYAFMLNDLVYRGEKDFAFKAKEGKKARGTLIP